MLFLSVASANVCSITYLCLWFQWLAVGGSSLSRVVMLSWVARSIFQDPKFHNH